MTDGLLILRAMLRLTGDALTAERVNTASPECAQRAANPHLDRVDARRGLLAVAACCANWLSIEMLIGIGLGYRNRLQVDFRLFGI